MRDHRDLVIEQLAADEAERNERITELEADNRLLRETVREAVDMLHRTNIQLDRATGRIRQLVKELRQAREQARAAAA